MASPFHVFRKNQKAMIATLGLLAIGAFVFLTPIAMYQSGSWSGGTGGDEVVVSTTKYGNLTERDINIMQNQKQRLLKFFMDLISASNQDDYVNIMRSQNLVQQFLGNTSEKAIVNTWLLAQQAKEQGMRVNDMIIADLVRDITNDKATPDLIRKIQAQNNLSEDAIFDMLQQELLALNLRNSFLTSLYPTTPGQRWNYFQRLKRKVSAQVSPVEIERFIAEVPEPTEKELKEFFEEHKNNIPSPGSPTPGFRAPKMADVEFIKVNYEQFATPQSVTDEEIEKYYLDNRDNFQIFDLPDLPKDMKTETPNMLRSLRDGIESTTETPATVAPEATKETAPEKPAEPAKQEEAPKEKEIEPEKTETKTSSNTRSVFHLVSMQEEKATEPATEKTAEAEINHTETKEDAQESEKSPSTPGIELSPATIGTGLSELNTSIEATPTISGKMYKPLEEVKDEIRHTLSLQKARERMEKLLGNIKKKIKDQNDKLAISEAEISEKETSKQLSKFVKEIAEENKLIYGKTGLLSALEIYDTKVGKSIIKDVHQPVAAVIIDRMNDQQLRISSDMDQNYYLFWRVEKTEEKTPKLEDEGVREKVIQAWKQVKARELALKEAERLAKEAKESGQTLRNSIGKSEGVPVKSTGEFSWFKHDFAPGIGQTLGVGHPENVDTPGADFMEAVYSLSPNEVTVAMNQPKTVAYVIQLTDTTPNDKVLWAIFKSDSYENYSRIAGDDIYRAASDWLKNIEKEAGLKWERSAISPSIQQQ